MTQEYLYSPGTGGFYLKGFGTCPGDVVDISDADRMAFLQATSNGRDASISEHGVVTIGALIQSDPMVDMRRTRDKLLETSDWTQLADAPITDEQKTMAAYYRNQLRDLPDSGSAIFPTPPDFLL